MTTLGSISLTSGLKVKISNSGIAARLAAYPTIGPQPISAARPQSRFLINVELNCTTPRIDEI